MRSRSRAARDERGAFLVMWALLIASLLTMVAIVIDLGDVRDTRRETQSVADLSALAAGDKFSSVDGRNPMAACMEAIDYINANLAGLPSLLSPSGFCRQSGKEIDKTICSPPHPPGQEYARPSQTLGEFTIEIHYPVPDSELLAIDPTTGIRSKDGDQCERFRVIIKRESKSVFAGVVGVNRLSSGASAVMRRLPPSTAEIPSLWLLEPNDCGALVVSGGAVVNVGTATNRGLVTLDSDGTGACSGQQSTTIDVNGAGSKLSALPASGTPRGAISLHAMPADATACNPTNFHDCDPSDVPAVLSPQPVRRDRRATRGPVDWKYDCKRDYPMYLGEIAISDCQASATTRPHISDLTGAVGGVGSVSGFTDYTGPCTVNGSPLVLTGNWRVPCANFVAKANVTFTGGNVVFDGSVRVEGGNTLSVNESNATNKLINACLGVVCPKESSRDAAFVYIRSGALEVSSGANLRMHHTTVVQRGGVFKFTGGGSPTWTAPAEGPFTSLALWNEFGGAFQLNGGAAMSLSGVFFTPYAHPFAISGGSPASQQDAQFVSRSLKIDGGARLNLSPQGAQSVPLPPPAALLIR